MPLYVVPVTNTIGLSLNQSGVEQLRARLEEGGVQLREFEQGTGRMLVLVEADSAAAAQPKALAAVHRFISDGANWDADVPSAWP